MGRYVQPSGASSTIQPTPLARCFHRGSAGLFSSSCRPLRPAGRLGRVPRPCRGPLAVIALRNYSGHDTPVSSPVVNEKGIVVWGALPACMHFHCSAAGMCALQAPHATLNPATCMAGYPCKV